jgi:2-C-methyl-D-erythritol 4-phosphate cytidylyltransferase
MPRLHWSASQAAPPPASTVDAARRRSTSAIVVAAGRGERFGAPKQFLTAGGRRLVDHAVAAAGAVCDEVVLVLPDGYEWDGAPVARCVAGGATRSASVRAGLDAVALDADIVVVHDAARALAPPGLFELVIDTVRAGADAAIPALPVTDTLKRVEGDHVTETVDRGDLVAVQTPQAFAAAALRAAHESGGDATDDASVVEANGGRVVVVPGDPRNLKVTTVADLVIVEALLAAEDEHAPGVAS